MMWSYVELRNTKALGPFFSTSVHLFDFQLCNIFALWSASGLTSWILCFLIVKWMQASRLHQFSRKRKPDVCRKHIIGHRAETESDLDNSEVLASPWISRAWVLCKVLGHLVLCFYSSRKWNLPTLHWLISLSTRCLIFNENQLHSQPIYLQWKQKTEYGFNFLMQCSPNKIDSYLKRRFIFANCLKIIKFTTMSSWSFCVSPFTTVMSTDSKTH